MNPEQPSLWNRFTLPHPQWWLLALSLLAWATFTLPLNPTHRHNHTAAYGTSLGIETFRWMIMVVAMMLPLAADSARDVAARSLWARRQHAITGFVLGYLSVWLIAGIAISLVISLLKSHAWLDPRIAIGVSFCIAVAWHCTPLKKRALFSCHRTMPIAPNGWRANLDCIQYGWMIGGSCLLNCWAWMALCVLMGHSLGVMLLASFVTVAERYPLRRIKGTVFVSP